MNCDPRFPQMADALNPAVMGPLLHSLLAMPNVMSEQLDCRVGEKRHKPGKSLLIGYRLEAKTDTTQLSRYVTGRLCAPGEADQEFALARAKRPDLSNGALTFLQEPAMLVWAFPYDRKLVYLPQLLDLAASTQRIQARDLSGDDQVLAVEFDVLHYLAERSCMLRYRVCLAQADEPRLLYAKNYADDSGRAVFALMRQLSDQFAWGAKALAYDAQTRTLWQSHVAGVTLRWADLQAKDGWALAERMGQCVAAFHACEIDSSQRFSQGDITQGLLATVRLAEQTRPELAEAIERAVAGLLALEPNLPEPALATIHHDLKLNNFLVDGNKLGLIDMDCVCLGDPLADLASLIANFYLHGLREGDAVEQVHPLVNQLLSAYRMHSVSVISLQSLRWQVAAALIHEVTRRSLRQMDTQRIEHIRSYLALSAAFAALCTQTIGSGDVLI